MQFVIKVIGCSVTAKTEVCLLPYEVDQKLLETVQETSLGFYNTKAAAREHNYFSNDLDNVSQNIRQCKFCSAGLRVRSTLRILQQRMITKRMYNRQDVWPQS